MKVQTIRVLLADDHIMLRDALAEMLRDEPGVEVVGLAGTGQEAVDLALSRQPDLVLMDVGMPGMNGIDATARLAEALPECRVIALSALDQRCFVRQMVAAGAKGYVLKNGSVLTLLQAIRQVQAGGTWLPELPALPALPGRTLLSRQEREVLRLLTEGQRGSEIAEHMGISVKTVDTYRRRMMGKLGFKSQAELTRYAVALGAADVKPAPKGR